jgi:PAS domain S-box-containing protein
MPEPLNCDHPTRPDHAQLYELLVRELTDFAVFLIDPSGCITSWNPGVERILGYTEREWLGRSTEIIFTQEDQGQALPEKEMTMAALEGRASDTRWHLRKNGERLFVEGTLVALRDQSGRLLGFSKIIRDITERQKTALRHSALVELGDGLRVLRKPAEMAGLLARILGQTLRAVRVGYGVVDATLETITVEEDWTNGQVEPARGSFRFADYGSALARSLRRGEVVVISDVTEDTRTADRASNFVALKVRALLDVPLLEKGRLVAALHVHDSVPRSWSEDTIDFVRATVDRTWSAMNHARSEIEREQLLQQVECSNEELTQFAHVVSHDLQAPIRGIRIFSQMLLRSYQPQLDPTARHYLQTIIKSADSMGTLVRTLLGYATVGQGTVTLSRVSLDSVLEAVVTSLHPLIAEAGASIEILPLPEVRGDAILLHQLFQNLLSNAVKYHSPGKVPKIVVRAQSHLDVWVISIKDNGPGIEPRYHQHIFAPLKRLHGTEIEGTGIGLAVCKRIVEGHRGRIWVESQLGQGATFLLHPAQDRRRINTTQSITLKMLQTRTSFS